VKAPTDAERRRWDLFRRVGCVACRIEGKRNFNVQVHHLNVGGRAGQKRRGHSETIPLCCWHHVSIPPEGKTQEWATNYMGPSLAKQSKAFREKYGSDDSLLAYTNDRLMNLDRF
jgi:hypothetical protein